MRKILTIILALFIFTTISKAQVYSTTAGGIWSDTTTWVGLALPGVNDSVIIQGPVTLYMVAPTIRHLQVTVDGSLFNSTVNRITVSGNVWMNGTIQTQDIESEFEIGGDLHLNGNWHAELTFIGTNDHNLSTASNIIFDPGHIYAYESKIIAKSDIYVNAPGWCEFIAKEIDLSEGYSMYLKNTRIGGYSYLINYGVRPNIIGGGNSITFRGTWQYYETCDLHDVTLYGLSRMGSDVGFYGEVINEDTLTIGGVPQTINVYGNFTNNNFVGAVGGDHPSFNFYQNFTNNGMFVSGNINFIGINDHLLITTDQNMFTYRGSFNSDEGKIVAMSNLNIDAQGYGNLIAKEIDLTNGFDLHLFNVRIGSNSAAYRNTITGGGNSLIMSGGQAFYEKCDIYDVNLRGETIINGDVNFYGEVTNQDTLHSNNNTVDVFGNFTNSGNIMYIPGYDKWTSFNFYQNFTNDGHCNILTATITGDVDNYILMPNDVAITGKFVLDAMLTGTNFQWQKDGDDISGANSQTFTFNSGLSATNYGEYKCVVDGNSSRIITIGSKEPSAFEITDVIITNLNATQTKVTWKTTVPATGFIFYAENDASSGYPYEAMEESGLVLEHSLTLDTLHFGATYYFIIDQNDEAWANNIRSEEFMFVAGDSLVSVKNEFQIPANYSLSQNFPNPFNPSTIVKYGIPEQSNVKIEIFNTLGQSVGVLVNSEKSAGFYETTWNAVNLPSGIYLISIRAEGMSSKKNFTQVKKALLLK